MAENFVGGSQVRIIIMEVYESKTDSKAIKNKDKIESNTFLEVEKILCNHCKRTSSNGIRCLGICVADNDY